MEKELFENLVQGLHEALDYAKGDKTKGRSLIVETHEEAEAETMQRVDQLLHAS